MSREIPQVNDVLRGLIPTGFDAARCTTSDSPAFTILSHTPNDRHTLCFVYMNATGSVGLIRASEIYLPHG